LSFIPVASSYIFNTLLNASQNLRILNIIGLLGFVLNIILNFILIPDYAALGAVYATLITQGLVGISHIILAQKTLTLRLPLSLFIRIALFGVLIWLILTFGISIFPVNWLIQFLLGGIICIPIGFILGLWNTSILKDLKP
ncbi:MAG: polysaccharide biosynthesis C-terminal domain-containing protein, partial [Saprospiraceae bacterium]